MKEFFINGADLYKSAYSTELIGQKAQRLITSVKYGFSVPKFVIVTSETYTYWLEKRKVPQGLLAVIEKSWRQENWRKCAFRSSADVEDGKKKSYAGFFKTLLNIEFFSIREAIESLYSDCEKKIMDSQTDGNIHFSIIIQEMINTSVSGVGFSRSPLGDSSYSLIECSSGLCEGVVNGTAEIDSYYLSRYGQPVKNEKNKGLISRTQISQLHNLLMRLEGKFGFPADCEWGISEAKLWLFQVRPINKTFPKLFHYTDSNLSESYPGTNSPFTNSIIPLFYENCFTDVAKMLGVKDKLLNRLRPHHKNLIHELHGHLYYNLEAYYSGLLPLPYGKKQIEHWHAMVGANKIDIELDENNLRSNFFQKATIVLNILKHVIFYNKIKRNFYRTQDSFCLKFEGRVKKEEDCKKLISLIGETMATPLGMGMALINDLFIMFILGIIKKSEKIGMQDLQFTKNGQELASIQPQNSLYLLKRILKQNSKSWETLEKAAKAHPWDFAEVFSYLKNNGEGENADLIANYLAEFGFRFFNDLKFENVPLADSPQMFMELISSMPTLPPGPAQNETDKEDKRKKLSLKWKIVNKILGSLTKEREKIRLLRSRQHHLVRTAMNKIIDGLLKSEVFAQINREDFFNLTLADYMKYAEGEWDLLEIKRRIQEVKKNHSPDVFFPELVCTDRINFMSAAIKENESEGNLLKGQMSSGHSITGKILIVDDPLDLIKDYGLADKILVTKTTDPAWVFLISRCRGVIVEKGNLLSHTSIVGRELNIPIIVGVKGASSELKNGMDVTIDHVQQEVKILFSQ